MFHRQPFVGYVVFYVIGVLFWPLIADFESISIVCLGCLIPVFFLFIIWFFYRKSQQLFSFLFALFCTICGMFRVGDVERNLKESLAEVIASDYTHYVCEITSIPEKRLKTIRYEARVVQILIDSTWQKVNFKVLIQIPDQSPVLPSSGDQLLVKGKLSEPLPALNPEEFDYRLYLQRKGIARTAYLNADYFDVIKLNSFKMRQWPNMASEWADRQFKSILQNNESYGLVKAMLLGRRDDLRTEQIDHYITSGTVHILSVSGMHVMLIFFVLKWMFSWLKRLPQGQYVFLVVICVLIGFYALITGLQPSVQRATWMCLVMVFAEAFQKRANAVNTLAFSAFFILLFDPLALYDVGFQLSYLAMLGIFLFYKPIQSLVNTEVWIYKTVWEITVMSFAAQLATFPLSVYYFHQFPVYFWLVNPFVIAATNVMLPAAMALLFVSLLPFTLLQTAVLWVVDWSAYLANKSVSIPSMLPHYLLESLYFDQIEVIWLYILMLLLWYLIDDREVRYIRYVFLGVVLYSFYAISGSLKTFYTTKAIVHQVPKHTVLSFKEGNRAYIFSNPEFKADSNSFQFHLKNYFTREQISHISYLDEEVPEYNPLRIYRFQEDEAVIQWGSNLLSVGNRINFHPEIHYNIIKGGSWPKIDRIAHGQLLLSSELTYRDRRKWEGELSRTNYPYYALYKQGSYSIP